jgi:hypothetical protein
MRSLGVECFSLKDRPNIREYDLPKFDEQYRDFVFLQFPPTFDKSRNASIKCQSLGGVASSIGRAADS